MATYFKFKTAADLSAAAAALGLHLPLSDDLSATFAPTAVGGRTVGNRWCVHPMEGCDGNPDGTPGELTVRRYVRFGDGGAKLLWGEACAVNESARANPRQIWLAPHTLAAFRDLVQQCRAAHRAANGDDSDLLLGLQLTHSGRYSFVPVVACRDAILEGRPGAKVPPLATDDELARLTDDYVATAKLAAQAGFDFVDVKQCHRYLLSELLGARNRPGRYGGSYENRTRLAREVIQGVRAAVPGLLVTTRLNLFDAVPFRKGPGDVGEPDPLAGPPANGWGLSAADPLTPDLTEPLRWIGEMVGLGVAAVNVSLGNPYAQPHFGRPFEVPPPDGYQSPEHPLVGVARHFDLTARVQQAYPTLPVVGTGYSYLQEFLPQAAAGNLAAGRATFAGVGRASLSQPDWVRQLRATGKLDRKRVCRTFSYCTAIMRERRHPLGQFPTGCPPFDKDGYADIWKDVQALAVRPK
jgi:2,4-dienoyl-CoA reductase-like NADH-dependent reductase (Old Yellow Enzyme family)